MKKMKTHNVHTHNMFSWGNSDSETADMRKRIVNNIAAARAHQDKFASYRENFLNSATNDIIEQISTDLVNHYKNFEPTKKFKFNSRDYFQQNESRFVDDTGKLFPKGHRKSRPYGNDLKIMMSEVAKELGPAVRMKAGLDDEIYYIELVRETVDTDDPANDPANDPDTLLV